MPVDRTLGALLHDAAVALACVFCLTLVAMPAAAQTGKFSKAEAAKLAGQVKREFLHAWTNYETYAWGHDELRPLSRTAKDWYGQPLLMTPVDALDTLMVMHLNGEADKARKLIDMKLSFNRDISVKNFEITIRLLGGLLSSYEMSNDPRLLQLADRPRRPAAARVPSPTGLPYVNCQSAHRRRERHRDESGGDRLAHSRVLHLVAADGKSGLLRQGQACAG